MPEFLDDNMILQASFITGHEPRIVKLILNSGFKFEITLHPTQSIIQKTHPCFKTSKI